MNLLKPIFEGCRVLVINLKYYFYTKVMGMDISRSARISVGVKLDRTNPKGIHIGEESYVASGSLILAHDYSRNIHTHTYIGKRCFIGANSIILSGIRIGDSVVVGAGAVVTKNVPNNCIVAGNPARVIREGIETTKFGQIRETAHV
jgi:acetyltransferase-like isoleucine patch superfamily enzyme